MNVGRLGLSGGFVSLHWIAASAGFAVVVVVSPPVVVVVWPAAVVFLSSPPPKRAAASTASTTASPINTAKRITLCFLRAARAASSWAAFPWARF